MIKRYKKFIKKLNHAYHVKPIVTIDTAKPKIFAWHFNKWKRNYIEQIFPDKQVVFFPFILTEKFFIKYWEKHLLDNENNSILVWSMNCPKFLQEFSNKHNVPVKFVEDGFLRSIGLGSSHELPLSLNFDSKTLYFNAKQESDLEHILNTYDFANDKILLDRAVNLKNKIIQEGISKYNHVTNVNLEKLYGEKTKKRILIIGQVEDDASIKFGCNKKVTNNDLVRIASKENPNAQIIYKPHPDVLYKRRKQLSNPNDVKNLALIITQPLPLAQSLETIDHVYTITSQVGFEALFRGIKVTTIGSPFYANWGLTDDRQMNERRSRKLTIDELFAGSYILYPKYYHPQTGLQISPEKAVDILIEQRKKYNEK